tara:strand:+ start:6480 stop:7607 length:1128 start_codon:yes stop_codon:yes gene_type:complete
VKLNALVDLRKKLHQHAEIAHKEIETAKIVTDFLEEQNPDQLIQNIGGYGLIAKFKGNKEGKTLLFRAELDALPIAESNSFNYKSKNELWGHKCGHDGHMAILCGLSDYLKEKDFPGVVYLLFQPAEETGEGAKKMIADFDFKKLKIDYAFALHNLPNFEKGQVILKENTFAAASSGVIIHLKGKPSHASHPQNGINPTMAAMQINQLLFELPQMHTALDEAALITPIGTQIGQKAFGTSAAEGSIYATIRTYKNENLNTLKKLLSTKAEAIAKMHNLGFNIEFVEHFQAVENHPQAYKIVKKAATEMNSKEVKEIFPWSEDFGHFSSLFPTCFLGLGAGKKQPQLHNEDYDFPDEILEDGITIFKNIIEEANNE